MHGFLQSAMIAGVLRRRAPPTAPRGDPAVLRRLLLLLLTLSAAFAQAAPPPYDESADAKAALQQALTASRSDGRPVLVIFGANWCEDCRVLDQTLKSGRNAELIAGEFRVVKVDVGRFNRNLDVTHAYGDPIKKGIPAAIVLSADNRVLYATRAGELADARRMSETGIYSFFENVVRTARDKP
jgi:thioredoxin 1